MSKVFLMPKLSVRKVRKLVYIRLEEINSPRALSVYLIMKYADQGGTDDPLLDLPPPRPEDYLNSSDFFSAYEPSELVRKADFLRLSVDPELNAVQKFWEAEESCRKANRRIRTTIPTGRVGQILDLARKNICDVLPELSKETLDRFIDRGGWGRGVTSSCKGDYLSEYNKFTAEPQCTPALKCVADALIKEVPSLSELHREVKVIHGSTLAFVPKDAKTHRAIAVEPSINGYLQRAAGLLIRDSLRRWGINLHSQVRNQDLAREGSITGRLATVDLSSASDTISKAVVELLLPSDWVAMLGLLRCEYFSYKGEVHRFHKWSSMGNAYTFELETLIFGSIVKAIHTLRRSTQPWTVYGDDIIIDVEGYEDLCEVLEYCGFSVNQRKSFSTGPFRESCGSDFFDGQQVRPFYLKEITEVTPYVWANWLLSNKQRIPDPTRTWNALFHALPYRLRYLVPRFSGVIGFEVDRMEASLFPTYRDSPKGWYVTGLRWRPRKLKRQKIDGPAAVAAHLRLLTARSPLHPLVPILESEALQVVGRTVGKWEQTTVIAEQWPALPIL